MERKLNSLIVESDRDRRTVQWLIKTVGQEKIDDAIGKLMGKRKPYISNVCKILGVSPPKNLEITDVETAKNKIAAIKEMLNKK
ncbi:hypothetical protein BUE93_22025 [Chromobacterium amazonense]|uniref:Cryptic plasmid protein A n=1 Tax=Chromobacterium amazonense TaxID=1382803 RepID=A0A2S9WYD4_9NEIS|nr:cryptic plasmid protein A [Chromobacterium amazonense]PRP68482.1 hypothetical protein BUE93_22025 [Chromobacterium amazonense]